MERELATYEFQDFISDMEMITAHEKDPRAMIDRISRKVKLIVSGKNFLTPEEQKPSDESYARHLVYIDRHRRFVVLSAVWQPGQATPIHDHGTWGVMGIFEGELKVTNYLRLDDAKKKGHARLRESAGIWSNRGSVTYVLPPNEEIHKVECAGEEPTVSFHVYGRDIIECNMYDMENETVQPYKPE